MFKDDPLIADWKQSVEEYRQKVEDDPAAHFAVLRLQGRLLELRPNERRRLLARILLERERRVLPDHVLLVAVDRTGIGESGRELVRPLLFHPALGRCFHERLDAGRRQAHVRRAAEDDGVR